MKTKGRVRKNFLKINGQYIIFGFVILFSLVVVGFFLNRVKLKIDLPSSDAATGSNITVLSPATDLGKWIDARSQGSYFAHSNSLFRGDDSGRIHLTYCSSGEPFDNSYAPDWRRTTTYATDKIRYQYSDDSGASWSSSSVLIQASRQKNFWQYNPAWKISRSWGSDGGFWEYDNEFKSWAWYQKDSSSNIGTGWRTVMRDQENLFQSGCSNSLVHFNKKYYLYFEAYSPPSGILAIHVARSDKPRGPYEIWTEDGWKRSPTTSTYKPVLQPDIRSADGAEEWLLTHHTNGVFSSDYWGVGAPKVINAKGKLYLFSVDTTHGAIFSGPDGILREGIPPAAAKPVNQLATSDDPTNFENLTNSQVSNGFGVPLNPKYSLGNKKFYNFFIKTINNQSKIVYQTSRDGKTWTEERVLSDFFSGHAIVNDSDYENNIPETLSSLIPMSDKYGRIDLSNLHMTYSKEYILNNAPVGWKDSPGYKWYHGGSDIYGLNIKLFGR